MPVFKRQIKKYSPHVAVKEKYRINELITAPVVRVVGDSIESKICNINEALEIAKNMDLDLVEINANANPPVCKVINYSKFKYEQDKNQQKMKSGSKKQEIKDIRLSSYIGDHDFDFKLKHAVEFLKKGAQVKIFIIFNRRNLSFKSTGEAVLLRFAQGLEEYGNLEFPPKLEERKMFISVVPKSKK